MNLKSFLVCCLFCLGAVFPAAPVFAANNVLQSSVSSYCGGQYTAQIKFAVIDEASSGNNTVVAAVTGKKIRVLSYFMIANATGVTARWESGAGGTALSGQMILPAAASVSSNCAPYGCFETAAGALLNLELSGAQSIDGHLTYVECE